MERYHYSSDEVVGIALPNQLVCGLVVHALNESKYYSSAWSIRYDHRFDNLETSITSIR
jgi:hypothetical protein